MPILSGLTGLASCPTEAGTARRSADAATDYSLGRCRPSRPFGRDRSRRFGVRRFSAAFFLCLGLCARVATKKRKEKKRRKSAALQNGRVTIHYLHILRILFPLRRTCLDDR